jgi:hypothetical protein
VVGEGLVATGARRHGEKKMRAMKRNKKCEKRWGTMLLGLRGSG